MRRRPAPPGTPLLGLLLGSLVLAAAPLAFGGGGGSGDAPAAGGREFLAIALGQPNSREHLVHVARFYRHAEVDLMLDSRGVLVGAHDPEQLARIERAAEPPLTLEELLTLPYRILFLDLKDTLARGGDGSGEAASDAAFVGRAERAVATAAAAIAASGRERAVFPMVYFASPAMLEAARRVGVSPMLQGYPRDEAAALALLRAAASHGMDRVCIPLRRVTDRVLAESRRLGITQIPYTFFQESWSEARYRRLVAEHLGGLIVPPSQGQRLAVLLRGE